jgi:hypothetical protein
MEGLAELLSSINVGEESFEYGLVPSRSKIGKPVTSWNEVFSDDYNPHVERNAERASSAYSQFWLVAHYALLNADADVDLNEYLRLWENGTPSLVAFETTFGASPKKLWDSELREYSRRIPYYPISFDTEQLDKEIRTEDAQDEEVQPIRDYLRISAKSKAGKYETVDVYAALSGSWGSASIDNSCPDRTTIQISDDKALITMERPEGFSFGDDGHYERLTYRIRSHKKNEFLTDLEQEWRTNDEGKLVSWYLVMPSNDWFCWRRADWDGKTCVAFHHRCEN